MKAATLSERGFSIEEHEVPAIAADEVLVRTDTCGVCEGDIATYRRVVGSSGSGSLLLGHEGSGIVVESGSAVKGFERGAAVTALGGGYADYFVAKADHLVRLPPSIAPARAYGEPLACCVHGAWRSGVRVGDRVAIVGCGFMGLVWMQLVAMQGASHICAFDLLDWRLREAQRLGASEVRRPDGAVDEDFDVVVEAAGSEEAIELSTRLVRQHGRLIIMAYHQSDGGYRRVPMKAWNFKALDVINAHVRRDDEKLQAMRTAVGLLDSGRLRIDGLVTEYPLVEVAGAFSELMSRKEGLFKAGLTSR